MLQIPATVELSRNACNARVPFSTFFSLLLEPILYNNKLIYRHSTIRQSEHKNTNWNLGLLGNTQTPIKIYAEITD